MNNETTGKLPLRASESVTVLEQQILGNIKRDGSGPFYNVENIEPVVETKKVAKKRKNKKKE